VKETDPGSQTLKMFRRLAPLSVAYMFYMLLSMASVRGVNLPMYTTLRRTTAAFTMGAEYLLAGLALFTLFGSQITKTPAAESHKVVCPRIFDS
jgi:hypothetical protein